MNSVLHPAPRTMFVPSAPILIPKKNEESEYSLKKSIFDPTKSSPPSSWNKRLIKRLDIYGGKRF